MDNFPIGYITDSRRREWMQLATDPEAMGYWDSRRAQLFVSRLARENPQQDYEDLVVDLIQDEILRSPLQPEELLGFSAAYAVFQGRCELHGITRPGTRFLKRCMIKAGFMPHHQSLGNTWKRG